MAADLVFSRPRYAGGPIDLVFGGGGGVDPGGIPSNVGGSSSLGLKMLSSGLTTYDNRNPSRVSVAVGSAFQKATPEHARMRMGWAVTDKQATELAAAWRGGGARTAEPLVRWVNSTPMVSEWVSRWERALAREDVRRFVHEAATPVFSQARAPWQQARKTGPGVTGTPFGQAIASHREMLAAFGSAAGFRLGVNAPYNTARAAALQLLAPWQIGRSPPPGLSVRITPVEPGRPPRVIDLDLVFCHPAYAGGMVNLVFGRTCPGAPVEPGLIVVPVRSVYMTVNALELRSVAGNVSMPARGFSMRLDVDSWTWSWSAVCSGAALGLLDPGSGDPVEMEAEINGVLYRLYAEEVSRTRRFGENALEVSGRGLAAELDSPYAPTLNFSASASRTAQQLAAEALQINGVGIGWDLDWQLTDWLVPGGVWAHHGAHISAVQKIVQAAGGYIQPHPTAKTLRVLHRYPSAPWDWAGLTPDIELPSDPVVVEGIRWTGRPAYNRVFLNGDVGANQWQVSRGGTAGDVNAPMIVDPMITHVDAARQRGRAELSNTGQQAAVSLSLPLLSETGLILPGKLVRYVDGAVTRLGMVRSTSLEWQRPKLRQVISLETHV